MTFFNKVTGPVVKLALATFIAYVMLIATIYLVPTLARWIISGGDFIADWIKKSAVADDSVMIVIDLVLDGKIFMIIPFLIVARILIEAVPYLVRKIPVYRIVTGTIGIAAIMGFAYILVT